MSRVYFFGCMTVPGDRHAGHFLYAPGRSRAGVRMVVDEDGSTPWTTADLDARLLCGSRKSWQVREDEQTQGLATLVHKDGWTALSLWDRTGDDRGLSNSALVAEGILDFDQMTNLFAATFPVLWERINGAASVTSHPSNPRRAPAEARRPGALEGDPLDRILAMVDGAPVAIGQPVLLDLEVTAVEEVRAELHARTR